MEERRKERQTVPQDGSHSEVMPNGDSGVGSPWPRDKEGVFVGRAAKAVESDTPGGHEPPLNVHKAFLFLYTNKKKILLVLY